MRKTKLYLLIAAIFLLSMFPAVGTNAASSTETKIDAVFAVDVSGSMKASDRNEVSYEAMKMFIDMASIQGDRIGIVSYTDQIVREKALLEINSAEDKKDLKIFINQLTRSSYTDTGLGLREAVKVLDSGSDPSHVPMIVLLTDGNTDLGEGKSIEEANKMLEEAIEAAKTKGYPVYAIGLNADGKLNTSVLKDISDRTGGKMFETSSANDLPQILSEIYASHLKLKVVKLTELVANGDYQEVKVAVPNDNVQEANISIMSSKQVELQLADTTGKQVPIPSEGVIYSGSKSYSLLKLVHPQQGEWLLRVKGVDKDKILINMVYNYDLGLSFGALPGSAMNVGDKAAIEAYFQSNGTKVDDPDLYNGITAKLVVANDATGQTKEVPLTVTPQGITGELEIMEAGNLSVTAVAEGNNFLRETPAAVIQVNAPAASPAPASTPTPAPAPAPEQAKEPFPWMIVIIACIAALAVIIGGLLLLAAYKKANRGFFGQMVLETRDENTGERSSPQYKKLNMFKGKFTLHQLLSLMPEYAECAKIVFKPGPGDTLIIYNEGSGTIEKGGRALDAGKGKEIRNNEKIKVLLQNINKSITIEYIK